MVQKRYLSWSEIDKLVERLTGQIGDSYDALLVVTRGGMIPACLISQRRNWRNILVAAVQFYTGIGETRDKPVFLQFPSDPLVHGKRLLVIDDIWDSGKTIAAVKRRLLAAGATPEIAVLHFKPQHSRVEGRPDYYAEETEEWIVYPWELHAPEEE
ncbi:MAG: phosphoribosyltransferase [Herpetosiphonaceae bacterium]|nr:MAG: phosphoribosyltransferase [Herpetosiphonaceae bacterium]